MAAIRFPLGFIVSVAIAIGLFVIMMKLIGRPPEINEEDKIKIVDIQMPEMEIETNVKEQLPDKPETPDEPPPEFDVPQTANVNVDTNISVSFSGKANVDIKASGLSVSDGEYLPIVKVAPVYPTRAAARGLQGHCTVEYTVTTSGAIRDPFVVEDDCTSSLFHKASVKAASKFKYKPRVIDGVAMEVPGVRNRFTYKLEQ